jgi:hypothetical protein
MPRSHCFDFAKIGLVDRLSMRSAVIVALLALLNFSGCASAPETALASVVKPAGESPGQAAQTGPGAFTAGSAAAQETARRLQANDPRLSVASKSGFREDPAYSESLAGSVILQSSVVRRSSAWFAVYRMASIEIHALPDGRVRVWSDFSNTGKVARVPQVYCRFNDNNEREVPAWRTLPSLKSGERRLVYFDSEDANVSRVTVLIR